MATVMQSMSTMGGKHVELESEEQQMELARRTGLPTKRAVMKLVNDMLTDAVKRGASDIHMEPYEKEFRVRFRIDGILQTIMTPPFKLKTPSPRV